MSNNQSVVAPFRQYTPISFTQVVIDDHFWNQRIQVNREKTIPAEYYQCETTGRIDSLKLTWRPGQTPVPHIFWDSDIAKWLEAASYSYSTHPDADLDKQMDEVIALIAAAQQPDGYFNVHFTVVEPEKRWTNLRDWHELYCAGHMTEAAVAHFQATGKRSLLDVMCRYADYIDSVFGAEPGKKQGYCGHQEIELALVKLYRVTNNGKYLNLARYFVDERGKQPHYYDIEARARGEDPAKFWAKSYEYNQSHVPAREWQTITGHSVRAMYYLSAMADLVGETGDQALFDACKRIWEDLTTRKMYLTGGIGSASANEGFTRPYDLPNETAYAETCAAIGLVFWSHRMLQLDCNRQYADVMERALYNGIISGVSLDGEKFFYENPLASLGEHHRQAWFDCSCCPPNLARLLASLGEYIYAQSEREAVVHLYIQGSGKLHVAGKEVTIHQQTNYPWEGEVSLKLEMKAPAAFGLRLRIPGWCRSAKLAVNGEAVDIAAKLDNGYVRLERTWKSGDTVTLSLDMPIERIHANPRVLQDQGRIALQRGPVVYCVEDADHEVGIHQLIVPAASKLSSHFEPNLLDGVVVITGEALAVAPESALYSADAPTLTACALKAIPYFVWDNRKPGQMRVWLPAMA